MLKRILILVILFLVFWGCEEGALNLKIKYDHLQGLEEGDTVLFKENHIGKVTQVFYTKEGDYLVHIAIRQAFANAATEDASFFITEDPRNKGKKAIEIIQTRKGGPPLRNGATVEGASKASAVLSQMEQNLANGIEDIGKAFDRLFEDLQNIPESAEYKKLEQELARLAEELKRSGESARERVKQEWLPTLKQEMEALRQRLQKLGREQEMEDLETQLERIKGI